MNLAQTLEALDLIIAVLRGFPAGLARNDALHTATSLRDTLPQMAADAKSYRKMIAAGPCDGWLHVCGSASEVSRRQLYAEEIAHGWTQKPLYALPETKESGT